MYLWELMQIMCWHKNLNWLWLRQNLHSSHVCLFENTDSQSRMTTWTWTYMIQLIVNMWTRFSVSIRFVDAEVLPYFHNFTTCYCGHFMFEMRIWKCHQKPSATTMCDSTTESFWFAARHHNVAQHPPRRKTIDHSLSPKRTQHQIRVHSARVCVMYACLYVCTVLLGWIAGPWECVRRRRKQHNMYIDHTQHSTTLTTLSVA